MTNARTITSVRFLPNGLHLAVFAVLSDGVTRKLFMYYPDELSFTEEELIGLTEAEAEMLYHHKDVEFLRK